jgi:hypothetical protein
MLASISGMTMVTCIRCTCCRYLLSRQPCVLYDCQELVMSYMMSPHPRRELAER